ncbi:Coatomer protein complex subunit epsilon, partial [Operophtera brumata]
MARQQQDVDELFDVKNAFYVGNYQQAINEAQSVSPSSPLIALQRDALLYRAYIAQGNSRIVLQELKTADPMLQPLRTLVEILHNAESLELRAFTLQCLLAMNRPDLARKQLKLLQDVEDDGTLTQLAQAWLNLSQ